MRNPFLPCVAVLLLGLFAACPGQLARNHYGLPATSQLTPYWPVDTYVLTGVTPAGVNPAVAWSPDMVAGDVIGFVLNTSYLSPGPSTLPIVQGYPLGMVFDTPGHNFVYVSGGAFLQLAPDAWAVVMPSAAAMPSLTGARTVTFYFMGLDLSGRHYIFVKDWFYDE